MANLLDKIFGGDKKIINKLEAIANKVNDLSEEYEKLSDEQLKNKTIEFRERLQNNETLDDIQVEAFATAREASRRINQEYPYLVQIMGAAAMHAGDIAEMKTGEGKTLTSVMCVYLNALSSKGVHVVTVNEYLASRDAEWMGRIYEFLGLSVGVNQRALTTTEKRKAYACDILYTTNSELGFDYLRDNMVVDVKDRVMRGLEVAIVDEVDSILIDESRTPLIISGGARKTANLYKQSDQFSKKLIEEDYEVDQKTRSIQLSETGVEKAERFFKVKNLYEIEHTQLVHHILQALKANFVMAKEVEYVVVEDEIVIVDPFTGRLMKGRAYSDGLHQALEAKEGVTIKQETSTLATITYQNFFRLYKKLAGMTGTAKTEEEEFLSTYNMRVIEIPTNKPVVRIDYTDAVFATKDAKYNAILNVIEELYEKGQPMLVGTVAVETSELLSKKLKARHIKHNVLNAKNHEREAEIIKNAGQVKAVTIATNMAGRGTDIKLSEEAKTLGGLAVIGTERHESRRIDNQLRGRSGRQGDPGCSKFFVSFQDELMVRFGGERAKGLVGRALGEEELQSKMISKTITTAQKRVEGYNFDMRKSLLEYDDVLRKQREIMYEQRNYILEHENVHDIVKEMFDRMTSTLVASNELKSRGEEGIDIESLNKGLEVLGVNNLDYDQNKIAKAEVEDALEYMKEYIFNCYNNKVLAVEPVAYSKFEKEVCLKLFDRNWIEHIDTMSKLRDGIHLRSYAQDNPLQAYIKEGYNMFQDMLEKTARDIVTFLLKVEIVAK